MGMSFSLFTLFLAFGDFSVLGQLMCSPLLINPRYQLAHLLFTFLTFLTVTLRVSFFLLSLSFDRLLFGSLSCGFVTANQTILVVRDFESDQIDQRSIWSI